MSNSEFLLFKCVSQQVMLYDSSFSKIEGCTLQQQQDTMGLACVRCNFLISQFSHVYQGMSNEYVQQGSVFQIQSIFF